MWKFCVLVVQLHIIASIRGCRIATWTPCVWYCCRKITLVALNKLRKVQTCAIQIRSKENFQKLPYRSLLRMHIDIDVYVSSLSYLTTQSTIISSWFRTNKKIESNCAGWRQMKMRNEIDQTSVGSYYTAWLDGN